MNVRFKMKACILVTGTILLNIYSNNAYVLVQVRNKGLNRSDIDAVIHKTVPTELVDQLTNKIARKHNLNDEPEMRSRHHHEKKLQRDDDGQGSIYFNLEVEKDDVKNNKKAILRDMKEVVGVVLNKIGTWTMSGFNFRSKDPFVVPKHVNLHNKPSIMYEVNTNSIMDVMSHVLASEQIAQLVDTISKQAAQVYRTTF